MRYRTPKRAREDRELAAITAVVLAESPWCLLGDRIRMKRPEHRCASGAIVSPRATCLHHLRKRSAGGAIALRANLLPSCGACNLLVEDEPEMAHALRLVVREGDPEWDALGARAARLAR